MTWTSAEERDINAVMVAGRIGRLPAIRVWRRFNGNAVKAIAAVSSNASVASGSRSHISLQNGVASAVLPPSATVEAT